MAAMSIRTSWCGDISLVAHFSICSVKNTSIPRPNQTFQPRLPVNSNCHDDVWQIADPLARPPLVRFTTDSLVCWSILSYLHRSNEIQAAYHRVHRSCRLEDVVFYQALFDPGHPASALRGWSIAIPLDGTVQLIQCSTKEVAHGIIRLQYGPKGKTLVMRAANAFERKKWIATIVDSLATHRAPNVATPTQTRTWKTVAQAIPRASSPNRVSITQELHPTVPGTPHSTFVALS
ncbi:hypothetical protein GQ600_23780 [Phytophthora cactorum]|nr:hypothetical protein GQ600_23780 [Phytophthora cactorum]